jgi:hypothetical protein
VDEQAFCGLTWKQGGACVTAFGPAFFAVQEEAAFLFAGFLGVAFVAVFDEQGAHLGLKKRQVGGGWRSRG